ncbi:hypothetical protein Tco_0204256 [Tanacetum coccineum]
MTGNKAYLAEFQDFNGGPELQHFNLFSVSQMCDKKNKVLFTDSKCLVLSPEFKLPDENQVLLKIPRQIKMYIFNYRELCSFRRIACFNLTKATTDESNKCAIGGWDNVKFKKLNKLVKGNLVKRFYLKDFSRDYTCVACQKGKQHKASYKAKSVSSISHSLQLLHMDLFGPTSVQKTIIDARDSEKEDESAQDCFVLPIWSFYSSTITPDLKTDEKREGPRKEEQAFLDELKRIKRQEKEANEEAKALRKEYAQETKNLVIQAGAAKASSTNIFSTVSTPAKASSTNLVNTVSIPVSTASPHEGLSLSDPTNPKQDDSEILPLKDIYQNSSDDIFTNSSYDDEGAMADFTNLETVVNVSPIPTSRIISSHPSALILRDPTSAVQTRSKVNKSSGAHAFVSYVQKQRRNNHKDFQHCLFACSCLKMNQEDFRSLLKMKLVDAIKEELLQFKISENFGYLYICLLGEGYA